VPTRVEVTGGWIEMREPDQVSERLRRPIELAFLDLSDDVAAAIDPERTDVRLSAADMAILHQANDLAAVAIVESWSFGPAVTVDALVDLPSVAYREILAATAPVALKLLPDFEVSPADDSPTSPSNV